MTKVYQIVYRDVYRFDDEIINMSGRIPVFSSKEKLREFASQHMMLKGVTIVDTPEELSDTIHYFIKELKLI